MPIKRPVEHWLKAQRALESARLLLKDGDLDGAGNRCYYAMFDAARAALLTQNPGLDSQFAKTHSGLMSVFNQRLVKENKTSRDIGKLLKRAEELRVLADYTLTELTHQDVAALIESAERFLEAMKGLCDVD
jgi:uncharacterized protein (UPF0332 family)